MKEKEKESEEKGEERKEQAEGMSKGPSFNCLFSFGSLSNAHCYPLRLMTEESIECTSRGEG